MPNFLFIAGIIVLLRWLRLIEQPQLPDVALSLSGGGHPPPSPPPPQMVFDHANVYVGQIIYQSNFYGSDERARLEADAGHGAESGGPLRWLASRLLEAKYAGEDGDAELD
ncbi:hypothetical protein PtrSN002B_006666 [Pyrenophora tritici-repentis]|uniref:Uncharacterized protein n=2 Tax=Pyrenophora tritici-repentis TaxID=45151 RepID=A0A2W1HK01_9PLEO|nr:hypothetical protein PtrV1_13828 [Pyrenophora tritici-repentis]KAF7569484.1 hypothetical protein PtrM4_118990 [Pyrenophora tritici-repentis]KAI0578040.1 hypothetical protein Alg130_08122 [Pyrenophora tritici-repentis]KAI0586783.1 hypothetical protein Alg215_01821 [Pyrenophora tritici-repentis]KAI0607610.1 hypothetical protein TUN205_08133 [Pyrenophora tritici-repentis]